MQQHFVEYLLALPLQSAGFKEPCMGIFHDKVLYPHLTYDSECWEYDYQFATTTDVDTDVLAPIYSQVFDWLETKMLFVKWWCNYKTGMCTVRITNEKDYILWMAQEGEEPKLYPSKKAAWDAGIEQALELLKKKS